MFLAKLAFKNLVRHRNRTLITASIIAIAIFFFLLLDSLIGGMTEMSYDTIINYEAGHLQLAHREYWEEEEELPLENLISGGQIFTSIEEVPGYYGSSPELNFPARLNNGFNELPVMGKGIIPDKFTRVFPIKDKFVEGEMFSRGEYKVVMGKRLAELMKLQLGDYITLLVKDKNETFNTIEAEISGLIHTANPNVNRNIVYLPLDIAQQTLGVGNRVSKVIVRLEDKELASMAARELKKQLGKTETGLGVYPWSELEAVTIAGAKNAGNQLVLTIILIIAAIAIINTVILAALERMEEIGMMKAMGLRVKEIVFVFVAESTGIGILGGSVGILMGAIGVWFLNSYGIDFSIMTNMDMTSFGIPILGKVYGIWNPSSFIMVFAFGIVVSLLSSILPAYWAAAKDPIKAIYHR
ncbi:ABC transporter permease [Halothermothrix orenii]|uniref:ABC-type transport system, involved in lipoprotein release, permease component n=1 Tax=Halothermothrix orenii (strain H 168 / OCM 544 / DSM 9562) TaxID=373903 RepID=B8D1C0_HALOH|nr:ABC transporter permease [Halothermothrix orenii]ACL71072.1 ABC-type transport system, involved in lipoprotein release, permease component [Halothermothrix orenii H 168]